MEGFPAYDEKTEPAVAQIEYQHFVKNYFKRYKMELPPEMQMHFTPQKIVETTSRYPAECACKDEDGVWKKSGIWDSGCSYFVGDEKRGYLIDANVCRIWESYGAIPHIEFNGKRFLNLPRKEILDHAIIVTYFKIMLIPGDARIAPGPGPVYEDPLVGQKKKE